MRYSHSQSNLAKNRARQKMVVGKHLVNMLPEFEIVAFFKRIAEIRQGRLALAAKAVSLHEHLPPSKR